MHYLAGRPIRTERCEKPTLEQLQEVQSRYIAELTRFVQSITLYVRVC